MKLFKNYDEDFEKLHKDVSKLSTKVVEKSDRDFLKIGGLEKEVKELKIAISQLTREIVKIKQISLDQQPNGLVEETIEIDDGDKPTRTPLDNITEKTNFESLAVPRMYDMKKGKFVNPNNTRRTINLNFEQLVVIIRGYKAGRTIPELLKHPLLLKLTKHQIRSNIYIWRAGGYNQAILDNARKLGYNPNKLISTEVEQ